MTLGLTKIIYKEKESSPTTNKNLNLLQSKEANNCRDIYQTTNVKNSVRFSKDL